MLPLFMDPALPVPHVSWLLNHQMPTAKPSRPCVRSWWRVIPTVWWLNWPLPLGAEFRVLSPIIWRFGADWTRNHWSACFILFLAEFAKAKTVSFVQAICSDWSLWLPEGEITWNNHWSQGDFPLIRCFTSRLVGAVDDKLGQHCSSSAGRWPVSPTNPSVKLLNCSYFHEKNHLIATCQLLCYHKKSLKSSIHEKSRFLETSPLPVPSALEVRINDLAAPPEALDPL